MRWFERITYSFTRIILANRVSRNLFALYCVGLHLLVFYAVFWMGSGTATGATGAMGVGLMEEMANGQTPVGTTEEGAGWGKENFDERL